VSGKRRKGHDPQPPPVPPGETPTAPAPVEPPTVPAVTARPLTRRQLRMERRKRRQRIGAVGIAGAVLVCLVIVAAIAFGVHKAVTHDNHPTPADQATVLLQIQSSAKTALGSVLLAHGPKVGNGVELLVPSQLITDVCGVGQVSFGQTLASANGEAVSRQAVSAALGGVTVDGSWVLSTSTFAKLIGELPQHGVVVDVDTNVIVHGLHGSSSIAVPQGNNRLLSGPQAVEYATYRVSANEDAASQLLRLQRVVDATVRALPHTTAAVSALLSKLGPGAGSTLGVTRLSALLVGLAADDAHSGGVLASDLPTEVIDSGGSPTYQVDTDRTKQLVETYFRSSLPAATKTSLITVELRNGVGTPGLDATACPKLAKAGLAYAGQGNAGTFNNPRSEVQINSESAADRAAGDTVARALGLPASDVVVAEFAQNGATVIVILGKDYHP
jgi:hypothetical protein